MQFGYRRTNIFVLVTWSRAVNDQTWIGWVGLPKLRAVLLTCIRSDRFSADRILFNVLLTAAMSHEYPYHASPLCGIFPGHPMGKSLGPSQ